MIDIQNITYRYAGQREPVFRDFSLRLSESRIYGLLGKNGTGKSTLLYLIAGLLRPQQGQVLCAPAPSLPKVRSFAPSCSADCDVAVIKRPAKFLRDLFIVTEEFDLPTMTLDAYVRLLAPFYPRFSHEVLQHCFDEFELPTSLRLNALSMGQKKKVYMSIALAARTRLLLMDEPTNGLDIPSKSQFRKIIARNMSDDQTLIISTHQVHDVEPLLDHLLILSDKGLLLNASLEALTASYTCTLQPAASPSLYGALSTHPAALYAEPTLQGNLVMARRREDDSETPLNLELLFNAVTKGLLR